MASAEVSKSSTPARDSLAILLSNLVWGIACPGTLCLTAMGIVAGGKVGLQGLDLLYWAAALLAPTVRHLEIRFLGGRVELPWTWSRYAARFLLVSAGLWLAAHGLAHLFGR
jgi:hypothetical protein